MADVTVLEVLLYDEPIATLTRVSGDRTVFAFNESYIENADRPTLSLSFQDEFGELITEFKTFQKKVMPFFSNLLPEGHMRDYLAQGAHVNPERDFMLLWALGLDLPGAITIRPSDGDAWPQNANHAADEHQLRNDLRQSVLRFSLAGVQLKFSAVNEATGGLTIPARGIGGSWIVKLPSTRFDGVPENEFSMMTLARDIGMDVPEIQLLDLDQIGNLPFEMAELKGQAFAIKRFDREEGASVHFEDFAQIFGEYPDDKYKKASFVNIARVIADKSDQSDIVEFVRRLTFSVLIGNADMHIKNWAVIYRDRRNATLAPAYDFVSTISYLKKTAAALKFSRTKLFNRFTEDELSHFAGRAKLPEKLVLDTANETVARFHEQWSKEKTHLPFDRKVRDAIDAHLKIVPIA